VLVIHLEDLVLLDREATYERLLGYLRLENEPAMDSFFESELTAERAHLGRWRAELGSAQREQVDVTYRETLRQLRDEGVTCAPPDRTLDVSYSIAEPRANPFDPWSDFS
jgi:hypothetical protein